MKIIPAIDILDGQCVRLTKGDFSTKKVYSSDPMSVAKEFEKLGATMLHMVDLNSAQTGLLKNNFANQELIIKISKAVSIPVEVGGGIRDIETARKYLNSGVKRIVIGTKAVMDSNFLPSLLEEFDSSRIVVAIEIKNGKVAIKGWQEVIEKNYLDFAKELKALGITEILFTDVEKDGSLTKPNFEVISELVQMGFNVIASGGVSNLEAISKLQKIGVLIPRGEHHVPKSAEGRFPKGLCPCGARLTPRCYPESAGKHLPHTPSGNGVASRSLRF